MNYLWLIPLAIIAAAVAWNFRATMRLIRGRAVIDAALAARKLLRRAWVLIAGTTIILIGIIISPLPGPGLSILGPIGLALIATEFVWAKRLLEHIKNRTSGVRSRIDRIAARSSRWLVIPVVVGYWASVVLIALYDPVPHIILWPASSIGFAPIFFWAIRVLRPPAPETPSEQPAPPGTGPERQPVS